MHTARHWRCLQKQQNIKMPCVPHPSSCPPYVHTLLSKGPRTGAEQRMQHSNTEHHIHNLAPITRAAVKQAFHFSRVQSRQKLSGGLHPDNNETGQTRSEVVRKGAARVNNIHVMKGKPWQIPSGHKTDNIAWLQLPGHLATIGAAPRSTWLPMAHSLLAPGDRIATPA